jgi:opacity protein-like surface antigen
MFRCTKRALVGAVFLAGAYAPALAADLYEPPIIEVPVYKEKFGGWYLRGHIGMSNQRVDSIHNVLFDTTDNIEFLDSGGFSSAPTFGIGVGFQANQWLRGDLTAEYRGKASFAALDRYETVDDGDPTTWDGANDYTAKKSEWLFLANAYADLGEWRGISPYVGAGIGATRNTIHNFRDVNVPNNGVAYGGTASKWDLAWALHAGIGFRATESLTIDLGYSYLNLGDARSGDLVAHDGTNMIDNPMHFRDITSHDLKLGFRYAFH